MRAHSEIIWRAVSDSAVERRGLALRIGCVLIWDEVPMDDGMWDWMVKETLAIRRGTAMGKGFIYVWEEEEA
jgi:hypothetical protein